MSDPQAFRSDEKTTLQGFLDFYRDAMTRKLDGLSEEEARFQPTPTANSLLTLIHHLTNVEINWFRTVITGDEVPRDRDAEFETPGPELTVPDAIAKYRAACAQSNEILSGVTLDEMCKHPRAQDRSVRWVVVHMLEETARHAGHADITRELIDGVTGF